MSVHLVVVFIPKGVIRHPERALRHTKQLSMRALIPLIQRGADVYDKPYHHASEKWLEVKDESDLRRAEGKDDYFIPICKVESYLRKDHHDMVFNTTALYGNTETRRVYTWREGTIGPLNRLENIAGARLRFLAMTRYPLPRPEVIKEEYTRKDGKKTARRMYVYGKTKGKTTVVITHPFLPELDFADLLRGHLVELCRQCFIHSVPVGAAQHYIDLLIYRLRPFLDRLYVGGAVRPSWSRLGTDQFLDRADMILDNLIQGITGSHGGRSSYPERVTERIRSGQDHPLKKPVLLKMISDRKIRDRLKTYLTDTDTAKVSGRINNIVGRVGTRLHRRTSWGLCSPSSLRGIIHGGDYIAEDTSGFIHATEVPVFGGRGKVDHNLFVRRQATPSLTRNNLGQGSWFPALSLDLKTKSAFNLGVKGKGDSKKGPVSVDFVLRRRQLTDSEWSEMLRNSPSPREQRQIDSYGSGVLEEYHRSVREDLKPPPINIRGVILIDGIDPPFLTRQVLTPFIHAVYHKIREDLSYLLTQTTGSTVEFPRSLFHSDNKKHSRLVIVTLPFEVPSTISLDVLFPLPVPLTETSVSNPFEHRTDDSNHFVLYESVATHGSPGDSAALIARNFHGLEYARDLAKRFDCREIAWLDLAGDYSDEVHRPLILRLHHQDEETKLFYREIEFIDLSDETNATLFNGVPVPSVEALTQRLEPYEMVIVSGTETAKALEPRTLSGLTDTLVTHIVSALTSTAKCTLWFGSPTSLATSSGVYKHHRFQPLRHDSPLLPYIDEIVLNLPYPPRPGGSEVPVCDYARGIVHIPHRTDEVLIVETRPIIPLIGWSRRFRSIDLTEMDKTMVRRLKRNSKTNRWLKKLGIVEFSGHIAAELFPFLEGRLSLVDSKKEVGEIEITREELLDKDRDRNYQGILSRVFFDKDLCQEESIKAIDSKRKYWTPRLEVRPLDSVPLPPPESDLVFEHYDPIRADSIELQRLQDVRRALLDCIPEYSPFNDFFREFVQVIIKAVESKKQQGFTNTLISFLRNHHYTKDIWYRTAWSRNHLDNWRLPRDMKTTLDKIQTQDADLLLRYGNYIILLIAYLLQSHNFSQNELNSLWDDVRPWVSLQLGAKRAKASLPDSGFDMDALYRFMSIRTQSFRNMVRSTTVPLTDVRYGITVGVEKKNPGNFEWYLFEDSPYGRGVIAGCIRQERFRFLRYLSSDTVTPLDELGALASQALTRGKVSPLMIANYSGMDVLYQGERAATHSLNVDFNEVRWEMRGATRFGTRYRGAPARLRYLKILGLGMTYPKIPRGQRLPRRDTSLAKRLFGHLGVIQSHMNHVTRVWCLVGGDIERGFIELTPRHKKRNGEGQTTISVQYHSSQEAVAVLQAPYRTGLPFQGMTWDPLEDIRYGPRVRPLEGRVTSELLRNRREV